MVDTENSGKRLASLRETGMLYGLDMQKAIKQIKKISAHLQPMIGVIGGGSWAACVHCRFVFTPKSNQRHICDECQTFIGRVIKRIKMRFGR